MKKKSLLCLLLIVIMLCLAIVACNRKEQIPELGQETGIYYYDADAQNEYSITLNSGNKFTFIVNGENKSGTYVRIDDKITLTFNKVTIDRVVVEKGPVTAIYNHDTRTLNYDNMLFLERVIYEVTFNSNGGTEVPSQYIVNGRYAKAPESPIYDKHALIGWYTDSTLNTKFNFNSDAITDTTELWAHWGETFNKTPFNVDLNLNYNDASKLDSLQTIGGRLYEDNLPKPTLDGHEFMGWWISMTDKANELTNIWTPDTEFEENTTLFALWQDTSKNISPLVYVDSTGIRWDSTGASSYKLEIAGPAGFSFEPKTTGSIEEKAPFTLTGEYTIKLTSASQTTTRKYIHKALSRVSLFQIVDSDTLVFNGVKNASNYRLSFACGNDKHDHMSMNIGNRTFYNFANCTMPMDGIKFKVTAEANGFVSSQSKEFEYNRKLDKIEKNDFNYEASTQILSWKAIKNATSYIVNGVDIGNKTSYSVKELPETTKMIIKVQPISRGYNSVESEYRGSKATVATPCNIRIEGDNIKWDSDSSNFDVRIGTANNPTTEKFFYLGSISGTVEVSVRARGATAAKDSLYSDPIIVTQTMSAISYYQNTVSWNFVAGVEKYEVRVNDDPVIITEPGQNKAMIELSLPKENTITVRPFGTTAAEDVSINVYAHVITLDTRGDGFFEQFKATGDMVALDTLEREKFLFWGWYNSITGPIGYGEKYTGQFVVSGEVTLYAYWTYRPNTITYNYGEADDSLDTIELTYNETFELIVPTDKKPTTISEEKVFIGWYTVPNGPYVAGKRLTDENGNGYGYDKWPIQEEIVVYAGWAQVLNFTKESDGYAVDAGAYATLVSTIDIPQQYNGEDVKVIKGNAFNGLKTLINLKIPNTIRLINEGALSGCTNLKSIEVKDWNASSIYRSKDDVLFKTNSNTESTGELDLIWYPHVKHGPYTIPFEVKNIPEKAFQDRMGLTSITLHSEIKSINAYAFQNSKIANITLFDGLERISNYAFDNSGITSIIIPNSVKEVGQYAFNNCKELMTAKLSEHVEYKDIEMYTFYGCSNLTSITLHRGIQHIGAYAFAKTGLLQITFPSTLVDTQISIEQNNSQYFLGIGAHAFEESALKKIIFAPAERTYENPLIVGDYAFRKCMNLKEIEFGEGFYIETLKNTFEACGFVNLTIAKNFVSLGVSAFDSCKDLKTVTLKSREKPILGSPLTTTTALPPIAGATGYVTFSGSTSNTPGKPSRQSRALDQTFTGCNMIQKIEFEDKFVTAKKNADIGMNFASASPALKEVINLPDAILYSSTVFGTAVEKLTFSADCSFTALPSILKDLPNLKILGIPSTVKSIADSSFASSGSKIEEINVVHKDGVTAAISSIDGIVYNAGKTEIIYVPKAHKSNI